MAQPGARRKGAGGNAGVYDSTEVHCVGGALPRELSRAQWRCPKAAREVVRGAGRGDLEAAPPVAGGNAGVYTITVQRRL